ncbi:phage tail sheath family protein [Amycolatopsis suaedae]|uniref:Phage tail sheath family protein n=1 Tax=Amycolatopsis suaedae TaxID=2510978 RepID=A0A4V2EKU9_9PSEU|nr:phage tail sheath C-terminal domain-containing protein [Amycolatopsis suaedae]RZQ59325.1 phage tail sheath family protein [Amycolatopsis suaedae]
MPISPTYPGVYIEELPSAVRTIIGVPTSIAAFIGTAPRGATDRPVHITSFADYEAEFGGLDKQSEMSHAVYHFYQNGGSEAEIVRIVRSANPPVKEGEPAPDPVPKLATKAKISLAGKKGSADAPLNLTAVSEGLWGNKLRVRIDYDTLEAPEARTVYNLTIRDTATGGLTERYLNVSPDPTSATSLKKLLAGSRLVAVLDGDDVMPNQHEPVGTKDGPKIGEDPFKNDKGTGEHAWYTEVGADEDVRGADGDPPEAFNYRGGSQGEEKKEGLYQLLKTDIFNILCLPGAVGQKDSPESIVTEAGQFCLDRRAMLILDSPRGQSLSDAAKAEFPALGDALKNAAIYYPRVEVPDPIQNNAAREAGSCGVVAGIWARTDVTRGVWKAPAGTEAGLTGVNRLTEELTDLEVGRLNPRGVNALHKLPAFGNVVWGARTLVGDDRKADQWKYVPVRRLALFIEESLYRGTQWVVFEPNDEPLWSSIRLNVGAFMNNLFRQGAFQGRTPQEAYKVTCDQTNNPQNTIDQGIVNIRVAFAPLKPAEFVIIQIQQLAGQIQV